MFKAREEAQDFFVLERLRYPVATYISGEREEVDVSLFGGGYQAEFTIYDGKPEDKCWSADGELIGWCLHLLESKGYRAYMTPSDIGYNVSLSKGIENNVVVRDHSNLADALLTCLREVAERENNG